MRTSMALTFMLAAGAGSCAPATRVSPSSEPPPLSADLDEQIPSQDDADRQAQQNITAENADAELDKLSKEIDRE